MKLDADDRTVLELLGPEPRSVGALAADLDASTDFDGSTDELDHHLHDLAEDGLVYDLGDGHFQRTDSGRRIVRRSAGATNYSIDGSPGLERAIASFHLAPDEADAVRGAFAFLRYWGRATADELIDAIFSEAPARYPTGDAWWTCCVREPLAAIPDVVPPIHPTESWRYAGPAEVTAPQSDGSRQLVHGGPQPYGSVKEALESLPLQPAEREAARAAFGFLRRCGAASERDIATAIHANYSAGYPTAEALWDGCLRDTFAQFPGVSRDGTGVWRYHQSIQRATSQQTANREHDR